jgi:predicted Zn-dependent protease
LVREQNIKEPASVKPIAKGEEASFRRLSKESARRQQDASSALARAVLLHPLYPPVHLKLGELAMALGDCTRAVAHLRTYLNLSREGADFATVRKWIDGCVERL